jgi:hypothetical protein
MSPSDLRENFLRQLKNNSDTGLTARQLAVGTELSVKKTNLYDVLKRMVELNLIEKIESLYYITDFGITQVKDETFNFDLDKMKKAVESPSVPASGFIEDFETRAVTTEIAQEEINAFLGDVSIKALDDRVDNMHIVRSILTKATQDIIARLNKPHVIDNRDAKIKKLLDIALQLNAESAELLTTIADDLAAA